MLDGLEGVKCNAMQGNARHFDCIQGQRAYHRIIGIGQSINGRDRVLGACMHVHG